MLLQRPKRGKNEFGLGPRLHYCAPFTNVFLIYLILYCILFVEYFDSAISNKLL